MCHHILLLTMSYVFLICSSEAPPRNRQGTHAYWNTANVPHAPSYIHFPHSKASGAYKTEPRCNSYGHQVTPLWLLCKCRGSKSPSCPALFLRLSPSVPHTAVCLAFSNLSHAALCLENMYPTTCSSSAPWGQSVPMPGLSIDAIAIILSRLKVSAVLPEPLGLLRQ